MPKKRPPGSSDDQEGPPPISFIFTDDEAGDWDAAVIRSLMLLSQQANGHDFADHPTPPANLLSWLEQASLQEVDGMLIATLHRWHELQ